MSLVAFARFCAGTGPLTHARRAIIPTALCWHWCHRRAPPRPTSTPPSTHRSPAHNRWGRGGKGTSACGNTRAVCSKATRRHGGAAAWGVGRRGPRAGATGGGLQCSSSHALLHLTHLSLCTLLGFDGLHNLDVAQHTRTAERHKLVRYLRCGAKLAPHGIRVLQCLVGIDV